MFFLFCLQIFHQFNILSYPTAFLIASSMFAITDCTEDTVRTVIDKNGCV